MEKALVYGTGKFYSSYKEDVMRDYDVIGFIDSFRAGETDGLPVALPSRELLAQDWDAVVLMVQSIPLCFELTHTIIDLCSDGIWTSDMKKIVWGVFEYGKYSHLIKKSFVLPDGRLRITVGEVSLNIGNATEFFNSMETLTNKTYSYFLNNRKQDVVIDIGMNIGDATLFFLSNVKTKKVYGYEPFIETYNAAKENLSDYEGTDRLSLHQVGISDCRCKKKIRYQRAMSCGQSTADGCDKYALEIYQQRGWLDDKFDEEEITLIAASDAIAPIVEAHKDCNIVLKMDCEGEEYGIIKNLADNSLLDKIDWIMLEWHYKGRETLLTALRDSGFSYYFTDKGEKMGLIYAWNTCR